MTSPWKYGLAAVLVIACGVFALRIQQVRQDEAPSPVSHADAIAIADENAEVFRRIFWRKPTEGDHILQSERRESNAEEGGVTQWDWFLAVDASAGLSSYLVKQNPFQLTLQTDELDLTQTPDWFPKDSAKLEVRQSLAGEMTVLLDVETARIYIWNKARGFQESAPLPEAPKAQSVDRSGGRLPDASPPILKP